ncbi:MAG: ABC transporter substrate-binding protein [Actinobacteria bacterium]|nr:ABC transporter substrate-binding protein [Actinomycetota bacterium]
MKRKLILISTLTLVMFLTITISFAGCKVSAKEPIKVGGPMPLTGYFAADGIEMKNGAELAIEEINKSGGLLGRQMQLITYDVEDNAAEKAIAASEALVLRDKVDVVVTGYAGVGADVEAFGKYDVIYLNGDGTYLASDLVKNNPEYSNVFFTAAVEKNWGEQIIDTMNNISYDFPNNKIAILIGDYDWEINVLSAAKERAITTGWEVVVDEIFPYYTVEWTPILTKIRDTEPSLILFEDVEPTDVETFVDQFLLNPTNSIVDIGYAMGLPQYIELAGNKHNGVMGWSTLAALPNEAGKAFTESYIAKFGHYPGNMAAATYDSVMLWVNAVRALGKIDHKAIKQYIEENPYSGVCGTYNYSLTDDHTVLADSENIPMHHYQLQNGNKVLGYLGGEIVEGFTFKIPDWIEQ